MADIFDHIAVYNFREMDADTLQSLRCHSEDALSGIMEGIRAMGSMAFWATGNADYSDDLAAADLRSMGLALMHLPRIAEAFNENAQSADFELKQREAAKK
ncbi:hypothetical protein [Acerihabitans sp.]|uniref:hypothetical protein n=1 Tax=Acerihabitans sp. TaxID=2811394 RepID=UPI002ED9C446